MNVWVIPCNEKNYNHREAFANLDHIDWRQSTNVEVGDEVYIYVGRPVGAVLYKCEAIKVNIANPDNNDVDYSYGELDPVGRYMRLKLLEKYPDDRFPREALLENGLKTVQGPTKATGELISFLGRKKAKKSVSYQDKYWEVYYPYVKYRLNKDGYSSSDSSVTTAVRDTFYLEKQLPDIDFLSWFKDDKTFETAKKKIENLIIKAERKKSNPKTDIKYYTRDIQYFYDFYKVIR